MPSANRSGSGSSLSADPDPTFQFDADPCRPGPTTMKYSDLLFFPGFRIRINLSCWIRIRIQIADPDPDPGGQKLPKKIDKKNRFSSLEVLDVLF